MVIVLFAQALPGGTHPRHTASSFSITTALSALLLQSHRKSNIHIPQRWKVPANILKCRHFTYSSFTNYLYINVAVVHFAKM